mmetsp:Transcript_80511/g.232679  ORF Transcript_80511/g.232679 Transcript_80511/m.232679 type:complete len:485 (+) Transcript_80511:410-1864(+)
MRTSEQVGRAGSENAPTKPRNAKGSVRANTLAKPLRGTSYRGLVQKFEIGAPLVVGLRTRNSATPALQTSCVEPHHRRARRSVRPCLGVIFPVRRQLQGLAEGGEALFHVDRELGPLVQEELDLEHHDMYIEALRVPLQAQASFAELIDVDPLRFVRVQQAEQHAGIVGVDVQRLDILAQMGVLQKELHLVARDEAGSIFVDLTENLPHVRHRELSLVLSLLDQHVLVVLGARDSALNEDAGEHIHDAEQDNSDIKDEEASVERVEGVKHRLEGVAPRHAARDSHKERQEAPMHGAVEPLEVRALRRRAEAVLEVRRGLAEEDPEEVDDEEEDDEGPEQGPRRGHQRESHFLKLACRPQRPQHPRRPCKAHHPRRPEETSQRGPMHVEGHQRKVASDADEHKKRVHEVPTPLRSPVELLPEHAEAEGHIQEEEAVEDGVSYIVAMCVARAVGDGLRLDREQDQARENDQGREHLVPKAPGEDAE